MLGRTGGSVCCTLSCVRVRERGSLLLEGGSCTQSPKCAVRCGLCAKRVTYGSHSYSVVSIRVGSQLSSYLPSSSPLHYLTVYFCACSNNGLCLCAYIVYAAHVTLLMLECTSEFLAYVFVFFLLISILV